MGRLSWLLVGLVIGGGAVYGAFNYHVLKTNEGFQLVPKQTANLVDTYVDIRAFTVADWTLHRQLAADIMAVEKGHLLGGAAGNTLESGLQGVLEGVRR